MKRAFRRDTNSVFIITCDNLGEYFAEFAKYRNSLNKENEWDESLIRIRYKDKESIAFFENDINNQIVDFLQKDYDNVFGGRNGRIELVLPVDLKSSEWLAQKEKVNQTLKEIWKTGENKNPYGLDLNWPQVKQPDQPSSEKKKLEQALNTLKYQKSPAEAEKILAAHIGFEKEKEWFKDQVYLYSATQGNFTPKNEVICYAGSPGTGKTTFVYRLSQATGRPCQTIACAGQKEFNDFSILGTKNKPSLVAWTIKESGCRNPLILLDELEKISNPQILKDMIQLFDLSQQKGKLFDPYFQIEIDFASITLFATTNNADELSPLFRNKVVVRKLEKFTPAEKEQILTLKSRQIEKEWGVSTREIYSPNIISELSHLPEEGVRQSEAVLHEILKQWILWKSDPINQGKKFSLEPDWVDKNTLIIPSYFQVKPRHYLLFTLWGITGVLLLIIIVKKWILKEQNNK